MDFLTPPPVRRLNRESESEAATLEQERAPATANGNGNATAAPPQEQAFGWATTHRRVGAPTLSIPRMEIDDVSVAYSGKRAVKNVSLPVRQGEVLALIGPSGCGKTTLLRSLNRLTELTPTATLDGQITLDGADIQSMEPTALRRLVTMVFQQPNPFPMTVFDNLAYVLREQGSRRARKSTLAPAIHAALQKAGLYDEVKENLSHPALKLSGGQQQRLCIARALAIQPEVLLLDEPCSALDPQSTQVIEELIVKLREDVAVVIVTHNLQQAYRIADYVGFMYLGDLVEYGPATQVFGSPREERTKEYVSGAFG